MKNYCFLSFSLRAPHSSLSDGSGCRCCSYNGDCWFWNPCCDENSIWLHSSSSIERTHFVARESHPKATFICNPVVGPRWFAILTSVELGVSRSFVAATDRYIEILPGLAPACVAGYLTDQIAHRNSGSRAATAKRSSPGRTSSGTDLAHSKTIH